MVIHMIFDNSFFFGLDELESRHVKLINGASV